MGRVVRLSAIVSDRKTKAAKQTRRGLFSDVRTLSELPADDIDGYAVVVWDRKGLMHSAYHTGEGAIVSSTMPTLVKDRLNRHLAAQTALDAWNNEET